MKKHSTLLSTVPFAIVIVWTICVTGLGMHGEPSFSRKYHPQNLPDVENKTKSLEVVSLVQNDDSFVLSLRNVSSKTVNGYSIGMGKSSRVDVDLTIGDRVFPPNTVTEERIPTSRVKVDPNASQQPGITILAVLFEDRSGEGDAQVVTLNKERRAATKEQLTLILPLLQNVLAVSDIEIHSALSKLKTQISLLPEKSEAGQSISAERGLRSAKEDSIADLRRIEGSKRDIRKELTTFVEDIKKRIARL